MSDEPQGAVVISMPGGEAVLVPEQYQKAVVVTGNGEAAILTYLDVVPQVVVQVGGFSIGGGVPEIIDSNVPITSGPPQLRFERDIDGDVQAMYLWTDD